MSDAVRTFSSAGRLALSRLRSLWRSQGDQALVSGPRGRLFRKYALLIVGLVGLVLLVNSALDFWFTYNENKTALFQIQQEKAGSAARRIEQFVDEIERQLGWTTAPQWAAGPLEQRRFDYVRLIRQVPAITELIQLDDTGKEQLKVSRLAIDVVGSGKDYSGSPSFIEARQHRIWFSPVYFRKESEPYMTLAMARAGRNAGVTIAEVNLKLILDVITGLKIGQGGYAYVVDRDGRLIAHPDISLVLRNTDLSNLPQVAAAHAEPSGEQAAFPTAKVAKSINGDSVLTAHAAIAPLGWAVFVELPLSEALAPLYGSALRTAALLVLALGLATLAALLLARRMTVPIRQLQTGAARIGAGELDRRIEIHTGDELEGLAGEFNRMAADLQKSYANLEKKVEDRTAELKEALDQQTATAEVLGVINSSPGDLAPVFDAMLEKAMRLCDASFGTLWTYDGEYMNASAIRGAPPQFVEFLRQGPHRPARVVQRSLLSGEPFEQIPDLTLTDGYRSGEPLPRAGADLGGVRTLLGVPLRKDDKVLGVFGVYRQEVRPFTDKQIALLQNFAAQAVIAMENARLITETREALEQQTATAEVLQVINSSPGDLAPVFQSIVEKAHTLCDAACGSLQLWDGEKFRGVAMRGFSEAMVEQLLLGYSPSDMPCQRLVEGERVVHCVDLAEIDSPVAREGGVKLGGVRTILYVALRKDDVLLGQIVAARQEVRPFSEKEIALVESFAAQAVIAMENARLITETREALEQQTATAEVLGVINSSPGDLAPVFDAMLEKATRLCDAGFGILWTYDGDSFHAVALRNVPAPYAQFVTRAPYRPDPRGAHGRVVSGEHLIHIVDAADTELYRLGDPLRRALVDLGGARSGIAVSLRKDETLLGIFVIYRQEVRPFSDKQIALVQNFAAQAVIAMENARLITETREALEQQTATAEVLGVINSSPGDLAPVFEAMLEKATRLCEAPFGILRTWDGERFHLGAVHGEPRIAEFVRRTGPFPPPRGSALDRLLRGERLVHMIDPTEEDTYRDSPLYRGFIDAANIRTSLTVPLRKDDALLGAITVYRQEVRPFTDKQIALLQNFAAQAVIAMENARLITETREALEQQTATAEVLGIISSSPGHLAPVFDAMLANALRVCAGKTGMLALFEGGGFKGVAEYGVGPEFTDTLSRLHHPPPGTGLDRLQKTKRAIQVEDCAAEAAYDPVRAANPKFTEVRTALHVPMLKENELLGAILIYRDQVRAFKAKEIELVENFAKQAVIAIENTRLITETREALEQQTATAEVLGVINSSPGDLAPVFEAILEKAHARCGAAIGGLAIYDGEHFRLVATRGYPERMVEALRRPFRGNFAHQQLVRGERYVHIPDMLAVATELNEPAGQATRDAGVRTILMVPLRKDDTLLGHISASRREVRPFAEKEIALLQNFAVQAVIAMENARLITETREALEQQTATAEVLGVINSSPGDLEPVFDAMLEKAMHLCEAAFGVLWTSDGERFHAVAMRGVPGAYADFACEPLHPAPETGLGRLLRGERLIHIMDIRAEEAYRSGDRLRVATVELGGARTLLVVPLRKDNSVLGAIAAYRQEVRPFSDKQIALLQNFAAQAVIAIENVRLITELRESLEYQTATSEVLKVISQSGADLEPVLEMLVETAARLCEAEQGYVFRLHENRHHLVASFGAATEFKEFMQQNPFAVDRGTLSGRTLLERRVVVIEDAASDPEYTWTEAQQRGNLHTGLGVPLLREDILVGVLVLYRSRVERFTEKQIALVTTFADQAVIAMENARLLNDLRGRTHDLQESLEYQTATSDVLKVISQSTFDLKPVLQTVLDTAMRLCGNSQGEIFRLEDGVYRMAVGYGMEPDYFDIEAKLAISPGPDTLVGRTALAGRPVQIIDALGDPDYAPKDDARIGKLRSMLGVPLLREGVPIGVICTARPTIEPFTAKQIELVSTFADQAVIAIENARLFNELRTRTAELGRSVDELRMLSEVGQAVSSTLDLRAVLSTILTRSVGLTGADAGAVFRYSRVDRSFHLTEAVGWDASLQRSIGDLRILESETAMGEATARRVPIQLADLVQRPSAPLRDVNLAAGFRGALIVPLVGPERILGALVLQRRAAGEFPPETVQLMQTLASQSVLAIQNARLFREIADKSEQLALASQHKSQFLANMSHELRTPLNAILGYAELLVDGIYGQLPERPSGVLERIQNNGRHLLALINDVLDLAKIEAGQLTLTLEDYSLPEVVQSVVTATEPLATSKGLKFTAAVQDNLPMAHGDARRVSQVLLNLVGNAIKFTDAGEIEIRADVERGQFVLAVRDTGPGIPDADQDRIFGEFQQIDNSNTRKKGGTGLGLAISKRMVEIQGGTISVDSVLGQGSTFRVVLPIHVDEVMEEAA